MQMKMKAASLLFLLVLNRQQKELGGGGNREMVWEILNSEKKEFGKLATPNIFVRSVQMSISLSIWIPTWARLLLHKQNELSPMRNL